MPNLFGIDIAGEIAQAMGEGLLPVSLVRTTPGTRTSSASTAGTNPADQTYACRGFSEDFAIAQIDGSLIREGDRKVLILGGTLPASVIPQPGDRVTIESTTWNVVRLLMRDPAAATYVLQVR